MRHIVTHTQRQWNHKWSDNVFLISNQFLYSFIELRSFFLLKIKVFSFVPFINDIFFLLFIPLRSNEQKKKKYHFNQLLSSIFSFHLYSFIFIVQKNDDYDMQSLSSETSKTRKSKVSSNGNLTNDDLNENHENLSQRSSTKLASSHIIHLSFSIFRFIIVHFLYRFIVQSNPVLIDL